MIRLPDWAKSALAIMVVFVLGSAYALASRRAADEVQVSAAAKRLSEMMESLPESSAAPAYADLAGVVMGASRNAGFMFEADAAARFPGVISPEKRAWAALCLAFDLAEESERGEPRPRVADVSRAGPALSAYPEWRAIVATDSAEPRIENTDGTAVRFLVRQMRSAAAEAKRTAAELAP